MIYPINSLLHEWGALANWCINSKKRVLEYASEVIAARYRNIDVNELFDSLMAREKWGSTALGNGVALPHARVAHCTHPLGVLMQLTNGIDFDAPDDKPVDLVFVLVAPEERSQAHLDALATLTKVFGDPHWCDWLRAAPDNATLYRRAILSPEDARQRRNESS